MPFSVSNAADSAAPLRVLITSHSHPRVMNGGSEVASYALFNQLRRRDDIKAWYCGCTRSTAFARAGQSITQPFERDEYLYSVGDFESFKFANRDTGFARDFRALLQNLRPDIVHFHHYINFGMEAFGYVRDVLPEARIILTLHEFLAICHQQGQMVTSVQGKLCRRSGNIECSRCFPEIQPSEFFLRTAFIRHFMKHVHHFVAPSRFLAQRYIEWGIPFERISVVENVPTAGRGTNPARRAGALPELRVAFFGQISTLKGIQVLIEAASILEHEGRTDIVFSIHGDHTHQHVTFQNEFLASVERCGSNLAFYGAYANGDVDDLMADIDVVLVPSIWWENSPVVIQEAFRNGRPVVCSNIGGMAEKVTVGETGLHFQAGSARSLVNTLKLLAADQPLLERLERNVRGQLDDDPLSRHLALYRMTRATSRQAASVPVEQVRSDFR